MTDTPEQVLHDAKTDAAIHPADIARLERAARSLPRVTREIFLASRLDDLSHDEIARITGLSREQVVRKVANAVHHIALCMEGAERPAWQRWLLARLPHLRW